MVPCPLYKLFLSKHFVVINCIVEYTIKWTVGMHDVKVFILDPIITRIPKTSTTETFIRIRCRSIICKFAINEWPTTDDTLINGRT